MVLDFSLSGDKRWKIAIKNKKSDYENKNNRLN